MRYMLNTFEKGDKNCMECCLCNRWFHGKCVNYAEEELIALALIMNKVNWYCPECNLGAANLHKHAIMFEERLGKLDAAVSDLHAKQSTMQEDIDTTKSEVKSNISEIKRNSARITSAKSEINALQNTQQANSTMITSLNSRVKDIPENLRNELKEDIGKLIDEKIKDDNFKATIVKKVQAEMKNEPQPAKEKDQNVNQWVNKLVIDKFEEMKSKEFPKPTDLNANKKNLDTAVQDICAERERIFARRNQLLIMNFKENTSSDEDKKELYELFNLLKLNQDVTIEKADRLGNKRRDGKPRFLRVEMSNTEMKRKILANATKLRDVPTGHKFHMVFIKPNLTEKQQEESKNLQAELKKRRDKDPTIPMKISKGKIVIIQKPNSD